MRVDIDRIDSLHNCCVSGGELKRVSDEGSDDMCWWWDVGVRWSNQAVGRKKCCMRGDAEPCGKGNIDVRKVWPSIDTLHGIMAVASNDEVYLCCRAGG